MNIVLTPFSKDDIDQLLNWVDSKELLLRWAGTFFQHPLSQSQCEQYLESAQQSPPSRIIFKALNKDTNEPVGHIELDGFDSENQSAFICRVLVGNPTYRGQGIGREMVKQLVNIAFTQLELHRLAVGVLEFNTSAIRCYEQAGFQHEGCYREIVKYDDQFHSLISMSLLRQEWQQMQQS